MLVRADTTGARKYPRSPIPVFGIAVDQEEAQQPPVGTGEGIFGHTLSLSIWVTVVRNTNQAHASMATGHYNAVSAVPVGASSWPISFYALLLA